MKNIFENARFGDKFKTNDGRMAIYYIAPNECRLHHSLIIQGEVRASLINDDGTHFEYDSIGVDIISKWDKPEENKYEQFAAEKQVLIDKACKWLKTNINDYYMTNEFEEWFDEMFNDFRKAMEE